MLLAGIIKIVTIGLGGVASEGAIVESKDVINSNILSLKCFNQVENGLGMRTLEQLPIPAQVRSV